MGYGVMPFAVDLTAVRAVFGAKDPSLVATYARGFAATFRDIGDMLESETNREASNDELLREIVHQVVMGEPYNREAGFAYGYFLEYLCGVLGRHLSNASWYPTHARVVDEVEHFFESAGVSKEALCVNRAVWDGSPVELPPIEDFPGIGFLKAGEIGLLLTSFEGVDLTSGEVDEDVRSAGQEFVSWLKICKEMERSLVCFYH